MPDDPRDHRAPAKGIPIRHITERSGRSESFSAEEVTGVLEGDDLRTARSHRPTDERIFRLEEKHDVLDAKVDRIEVAVADMGGQFKVIPRLVDAMEKATTAFQQREHVTLTAKVDIDKVQAIGNVEVKKAKWQLLIKIVAILGAIGTAISTAIAAKGC